MGSYVSSRLVKAMLKRRLQVDGARLLIRGLTFKENCPDLRNTRLVYVVAELFDYGGQVDVLDRWVDPADAKHDFGLDLVTTRWKAAYDGAILDVRHNSYCDAEAEALRGYCGSDHVFCDLKSVFARDESNLRL